MIRYPIHHPLGEALIFLNGRRTSIAPALNDLNAYQQIVIADGAWNDLCQTSIGKQAQQRGLILGDGDSINQRPDEFVTTSDQNLTDFEKIIHNLLKQGITSADIYWGSGGEMDHFLGNLSVAAKYGHAIFLRFLDTTQSYFYLAEDCQIIGAVGHQLSIYPFPKTLVTSIGLRYEMTNQLLKQYAEQSLRNQIIAETAHLQLHGNAFIFISHQAV